MTVIVAAAGPPPLLNNMQPNSPRSSHLDFLRGMASVVVVVGHARAFWYVDADLLSDPSPAALLLYSATALGHQAVMVFFALSGFLVGGPAIKTILERRWSFATYLIIRLTRLWLVAVPALLLTLLMDVLGASLFGREAYLGSLHGLLSSGPSPEAPASHSLLSFLGNAAFLQTLAVPVYGSNGPLWSLANEFWYYLIFPLLLFGGVKARVHWTGLVIVFACLIALFLIPPVMAQLGVIWLAGAVLGSLHACQKLPKAIYGGPYILVALAATLASLIASKLSAGIVADICLGVLVSALLPALAAPHQSKSLYSRVAMGLSEISYSLYLTHFPVLFILFLFTSAPNQHPLELGTLWMGFFGIIASLAVATTFWLLFERHTKGVRSHVLSTVRDLYPALSLAK